MTLISIQTHNLVHNVSTIIICRGEQMERKKVTKETGKKFTKLAQAAAKKTGAKLVKVKVK